MAGEASNRIVFLCSGGGGNLSFLYHAIQFGYLPRTEIIGVLTDLQCSANSFSTRKGLYNRIIEIKDCDQEDLLSELENLKPDLIITTVHKIIRQDILNFYPNKLINLHYSLLPAFSGLIGTRPVKEALKHNVLFSGVTVHLVNEQVDAGRPLVQGVIALNTDETFERLMPVVFRTGCIALLLTLNEKLSGLGFLSSATSINVLGYNCLFNGGGAVPEGLVSNEKFWGKIKESLD